MCLYVNLFIYRRFLWGCIMGIQRVGMNFNCLKNIIKKGFMVIKIFLALFVFFFFENLYFFLYYRGRFRMVIILLKAFWSSCQFFSRFIQVYINSHQQSVLNYKLYQFTYLVRRCNVLGDTLIFCGRIWLIKAQVVINVTDNWWSWWH